MSCTIVGERDACASELIWCAPHPRSINWYLDIPVMPYLRKYNKRYFGFPEKLMAEFEKNVTEVLGLKDFVKNNL